MSPDVNQQISKSTIWLTVFGGLMLLAGGIAIALPFLFSQAIVVIMAWVFLGGGIIRLVHALQTQEAQGFWLKCAIAALYLLVSALLFTGLVGQTKSIGLGLAIGSTIFLEGVLEIVLAFQMRPQGGRNWVLASGIFSIILGILLFANRPLGAVWLIGLMVGISLIITGTWFIMLSVGIRGATTP
jgi:uncharacterized membrane protein HdeD (DUF308 family)